VGQQSSNVCLYDPEAGGLYGVNHGMFGLLTLFVFATLTASPLASPTKRPSSENDSSLGLSGLEIWHTRLECAKWRDLHRWPMGRQATGAHTSALNEIRPQLALSPAWLNPPASVAVRPTAICFQ
jgi:hypothetical protein